jgi:hypothetical protein
LHNILNGKLASNVPENAPSKDMKNMPEAFGSMVISLRFASDSYAK